MSSFKSNENIHKKEGGSYYVVSANNLKADLKGPKVKYKLHYKPFDNNTQIDVAKKMNLK